MKKLSEYLEEKNKKFRPFMPNASKKLQALERHLTIPEILDQVLSRLPGTEEDEILSAILKDFKDKL